MKKGYLNFLKNIRRLESSKTRYVFIVLIILQFSLLPLIPVEFKSQADYDKYVNFSYLYVMSSYTMMIVGLIIFQIHKLEILSDHLSLGLIVFSCLIRYSLRGNNEFTYLLYLIFLGLGFLVYIIANRKTIKLPDGRVFIFGLLWSFVTLIVIALSHAMLGTNQLTVPPQNLLNYLVSGFLFQISFVTVIEEVCFRGLIFGFLVLNNYKEDTAFTIQAILFWGIHYMRISSPVLFFITIPLLTLSTTLIMRKYKVLYLPIMIHTIVNIFTPILASVISQYLF